MIKIGVLLADAGGEISARFLAMQHEMNIKIYIKYHVTEESARGDIQSLIDDYGIEAVICRNPLSFFVKKISPIPVETLNITEGDIVRAVYRANPPVKSFAFYFYMSDKEKYSQIEQELARMTGCKCILPALEYDQSYDYGLMERIYYDMLTECDAVVTGTTMVGQLFENHGKRALYLSAEWYRIRECIMDAMNDIRFYRREKYQLQLSEWALDNTKGYFIMSRDSKIIMVNDQLCRYLDIRKEKILGVSNDDFFKMHPLLKKAEEVYFRGIVRYKNNEYILGFQRKKILEKGEPIEIYTMMNVSDVQSKEYSIRREKTKTGFDAKWHFDDIVSDNNCMKNLLQRAVKYAHSGANILVTGESGTGKEVLVQSIHNESSFREGPFVAINCSAIPETLLESELFGYEDGAFTGAKKGGKAGMFELSHGGTLFLDEIGEMPLAAQAKLLRCIQERAVTRVGGSKPIPIINRLICATNRNLLEEVKKGNFRVDLYYRINILTLHIPALRERKEDIAYLADRFWYREQGEKNYRSLPKELQYDLERYRWPGNIRELEAFIQRLSAIEWTYDMKDPQLKEILFELAGKQEDGGWQEEKDAEEYLYIKRGTMEQMQKEILLKEYKECDGNLRKVARQLELGYSTVLRKMAKTE